MKLIMTNRGFEVVEMVEASEERTSRLVQQSSVIGDYSDSENRPGSSYLWVGADHHLNREEVAELRDRLTAWLLTGSLRLKGEQ